MRRHPVFHLLIVQEEGAWNFPSHNIMDERFLYKAYTSIWLREKYESLTRENVEELKTFPALFTYEGGNKPARIGYIRDIRRSRGRVVFEYQFDERIPEFSFSQLKKFLPLLHIDDEWELGATHWALKERDLFEALVVAGVVDGSFLTAEDEELRRVEDRHFKVAVSFSGDRRAYVADVVAELKKRLPKGAVFYDRDFTAELAAPNLDNRLQRIYGENSDLVVVFLSRDYQERMWCGIEWRAIRRILNNRKDHSIMYLRFEDVVLEGILPQDGYVDLDHFQPLEAANMALHRVRLNDAEVQS